MDQSAPARSPGRRHLLWSVPLVVGAFAVITAVLAVSVLPASLTADTNGAAYTSWHSPEQLPEDAEATPYAIVPASAEPVAPRLAFDAVQRHPAKGQLLFVTIRQPKMSILDSWVAEKLSPAVRYLTYRDVFGDSTPSQQQESNIQMMRTAQQTAEYVALNLLGYPAEIVPGEVIIGRILCFEASADGMTCTKFPPADELLDNGDTLLSVDGTELSIIDDLGPILARHAPGDRVKVTFKRPGKGEMSGEIELIAAPDDSKRTIIGFEPFDTATAKLPFDVEIDTSAIGGPSAGLAFTLTLIDELTPGELTGDTKIAVTGTISIDGQVGPIGGLSAKTLAVKQSGAKVFIVPTAQGLDPNNPDSIESARAVAGDSLTIVDVATVEEALAALARYGGNGLELGKPGATFRAPS